MLFEPFENISIDFAQVLYNSSPFNFLQVKDAEGIDYLDRNLMDQTENEPF